MLSSVSRRNLADPDYEPTDEELVELAHEAFAGVREANEAALARMREVWRPRPSSPGAH